MPCKDFLRTLRPGMDWEEDRKRVLQRLTLISRGCTLTYRFVHRVRNNLARFGVLHKYKEFKAKDTARTVHENMAH